MKNFNRKNVRTWMRKNHEDYRDPITGEINATLLVESAATEFGKNHLHGPLDDDGHWIWDIALEFKN